MGPPFENCTTLNATPNLVVIRIVVQAFLFIIVVVVLEVRVIDFDISEVVPVLRLCCFFDYYYFLIVVIQCGFDDLDTVTRTGDQLFDHLHEVELFAPPLQNREAFFSGLFLVVRVTTFLFHAAAVEDPDCSFAFRSLLASFTRGRLLASGLLFLLWGFFRIIIGNPSRFGGVVLSAKFKSTLCHLRSHYCRGQNVLNPEHAGCAAIFCTESERDVERTGSAKRGHRKGQRIARPIPADHRLANRENVAAPKHRSTPHS